MLLPERTFDIWVSLAVVRMFPCEDILVWGPTPPEQFDREPYDLALEGLAKPLFLENKGLKENRNITIDMEQFNKLFVADLLARIESEQREKTRGFIWYMLPVFDGRNLRDFAHQNDTEENALVFSPMDVFMITSHLRGGCGWLDQKTFDLDVDEVQLAHNNLAVGYLFREFFSEIQKCSVGAVLDDPDEVKDIMNHVTRQMCRPISIEENELLRDYLRAQMEEEGKNFDEERLNRLIGHLTEYKPKPGVIPMTIPFPIR